MQSTLTPEQQPEKDRRRIGTGSRMVNGTGGKSKTFYTNQQPQQDAETETAFGV